MKLDFNFNLKEPDGIENKQMNAGIILSQELAREMVTDETKILKFFDWSKLLSNKKPLDLDKADQEILKKAIIDNKNLIALIKGQLLEKFDIKKKE
jgi:hypothetical protein